METSLGSMTRLGYNWAVIDMITLTLLLGSFGVNLNLFPLCSLPYRHPMKDTCIPPPPAASSPFPPPEKKTHRKKFPALDVNILVNKIRLHVG